MKRTGAIFVEVVVSILLFTVGLLALTGTLFYGVKVVAESKEETINEQEYKNTVEEESLGIIMKGSSFTVQETSFNIDVFELPFDNIKVSGSGDINLDFIPYRYMQKNKKGNKTGTEIYLLLKKE